MTISLWAFPLAGLSVFVVVYAGYLAVHAWAFLRLQHRLRTRPLRPLNRQRPRVAVVIPQRNEAANISRCLRALVAQDYPQESFQIIVVDDHSIDGSPALVQAMMDWHPELITLIRLQGQPAVAQKKKAIAVGISAAYRAEYIVTLDADCLPGPNWLSTLTAQFHPGVAFLAGPIRKVPTKMSFLQQVQCAESAGMVALAAGAIELGLPMMANGGNLGFRLAAFQQVGGYAGIDQVASGDDELLMHKMHHAFRDLQPTRPVAYCLHPDAIVETPAVANWDELRQQRIRWVSKARAYNHPLMSLAQVNAYLANLALAVATLVLGINPALWPWTVALWSLKLVAESLVLVPALRFLNQRQLLPWALLGQPLHVAYVLWVGVAGTFAKSYTWKGRRVH